MDPAPFDFAVFGEFFVLGLGVPLVFWVVGRFASQLLRSF